MDLDKFISGKSADLQRIAALEAQVVALQGDRARLVAMDRELDSRTFWWLHEDTFACKFCGAFCDYYNNMEINHEPDCFVMRRNALLAELEGEAK